MVAFFGDEPEAIPLGLENPLFVVEGFVDQCREHRSVGGIHACFCIERLQSLQDVAWLTVVGGFLGNRSPPTHEL